MVDFFHFSHILTDGLLEKVNGFSFYFVQLENPFLGPWQKNWRFSHFCHDLIDICVNFMIDFMNSVKRTGGLVFSNAILLKNPFPYLTQVRIFVRE